MEAQKSLIPDLVNKIKSNGQKKPLQKVVPSTSKIADEVQFSFYLEKSKLKQLKQYALDHNMSNKEVINLGIDMVLQNDK